MEQPFINVLESVFPLPK